MAGVVTERSAQWRTHLIGSTRAVSCASLTRTGVTAAPFASLGRSCGSWESVAGFAVATWVTLWRSEHLDGKNGAGARESGASTPFFLSRCTPGQAGTTNAAGTAWVPTAYVGDVVSIRRSASASRLLDQLGAGGRRLTPQMSCFLDIFLALRFGRRLAALAANLRCALRQMSCFLDIFLALRFGRRLAALAANLRCALRQMS
ncbi:hypothetical protein [Barrientosiimonas endolithica]|nr:hypothetical protein [Barrientosiimonas endolithica]